MIQQDETDAPQHEKDSEMQDEQIDSSSSFLAEDIITKNFKGRIR
jgi:hypothetical protein